MDDDKDNKKEDQKIYWCQCGGENPEIAKHIKLGSVPKDTGKVCRECGGIIFEEEKKDYKDILKKYLELSKKIFGAGRIQPISGHYESNILPHDEFEKIRDELEFYLDYMSDEELCSLILDPKIGPKAGAILDERNKSRQLNENH